MHDADPADPGAGATPSDTAAAGLSASYFIVPGGVSRLSEIDFTAAPDAAGVVGSLDTVTTNDAFWQGGPADNFAARYAGSLVVETAGRYTLHLTSDDGSALFLDGAQVIDNDGAHAATTRQVTLDLAAGSHPLELLYFERDGVQTLQLDWQGPDTGGARQTIDGSAFAQDADPADPGAGTGAVAAPSETAAASPASARLEAGTLTLGQADPDQWHSVTFSKPILDARVVMGPVTGNGSDPVVARVRNVTDTGFEIQLDEWDYLDGWHTKETVSWVAGSAGTHTLANGQTVSFGRTTLQDDTSAQVTLSGFSKTPAVFAQVTSANDAAAVTQRINAVTAGGFTMRLQEEEAADQRHAAETVDWLAIDYGTAGALDAGLATASHRSATVSFDAQAGVPVFLAAQQTRNGGDTAAVRLQDLGGTGATFIIEEERSRDGETGHVDEQVAYLSLAAGTVLDLAAHVPPAVPSLSFVVSADGPSGTGTWVDRDASADVSPGDILTYTYTLSNDGDVALTNVTLSDASAPGLSAAVLSGLTDTDGDGLADDLAVGTVATATYRYTVMAGDGGTVLTSVATAATTETAARSATLTQMVANPAPVVNTPPAAVDDRVATGYGAPLALDAADLLANDGDADGDPLSRGGCPGA